MLEFERDLIRERTREYSARKAKQHETFPLFAPSIALQLNRG
jgi:hypothetical protein